MDDSLFDDAMRYAETRARCVAAHERAIEVVNQAVIALKVARERLERAQAARATAAAGRGGGGANRLHDRTP